MRVMGVMAVLAVMGALTACAATEIGPDDGAQSEVTQAGTTVQGTTVQGTTVQGTTVQGTTVQGTTVQGATYGGSPVTGTVVGTAISIWRSRKDLSWPHEQRLPGKICLWNKQKTVSSCTTVNLATAPSPLAGTLFDATFVDRAHPEAPPVHRTLRIGSGTSDVGAVGPDSTSAMFLLVGGDAQTVTRDHRASCPQPAQGCTMNSDLWLYDVELIDVDGSAHPFCASGRAMAMLGAWDDTGAMTSDPVHGPLFTFGCTDGTLVKCARWGYRPWTAAVPSGGGDPVPLADYHQACIRAAMADYCAMGHSFTTNGTVVDVWDYQPRLAFANGFIPRTMVLHYDDADRPTAFAGESEFDRYGATAVDFTRHEELAATPSYGTLESICPGHFSWPTAPMAGDPLEIHRPWTRIDPPVSGPRVWIDSTPACGHSEQTLGKFLHHQCSACTREMWDTISAADQTLAHCFAPPGRWDEPCVAAATGCSQPTMAQHGECTAGTTGAALSIYDSGCTIAVCSDPAHASCCSTGWGSACVEAANAVCKGGREGGIQPRGFCGTSLTSGTTGNGS
jgi:hypothetical protein